MAATPGANPSAWIDLELDLQHGTEGRYAAHDSRFPVPLIVDECTNPAIKEG
jgi:hypothetical protein